MRAAEQQPAGGRAGSGARLRPALRRPESLDEMNHKRGRLKHSRAGCLLCKPNKIGKGMENKLGHRGFGKLRREAAAAWDLRPGRGQ